MSRFVWLSLCVLFATGCEGGIIRPVADGSPPPRWDQGPPPTWDRGTPFPDFPPQPDQGIGTDLPTTPLDPCLTGKCANEMLCIANICHATCNQTDPQCNDKVTECGPQTACRPASSFSDACFPAAPVGTDCSDGTNCEGGTLCVNTGTKIKCLRLCKYGCSKQCVKTTTGCDVCNE